MHLVVHRHCVGACLAQVVLITVEITVRGVASKVLVASMNWRDVVWLRGTSDRLLHCKLIIEVLDVFQWFLIVLLRILIVCNGSSIHYNLMIFFVWTGFIFRKAVKIERRNVLRPLFNYIWSSTQEVIGIIRVEAVVILRVCLFIYSTWRRHTVHDVRVFVKEFLESGRWNVFNFLFKYLVNGVSTVLKDVDKIHYFLLSEL